MFIDECRKELTAHIIPFWAALEDKENGGFYGFVSHDLALDKAAPKGVILNSRILWFFSSCYAMLGDAECLRLAGHAFAFLKNHCTDKEYGGVYWMLDCKGNPLDTMKHTYNVAFAIYALAAYYNACGDREALSLAKRLFEDVEARTPDAYGYREAFTRDWTPTANDALSENGLTAEKTMNAVLHLIEAYTELYKAEPDARVGERLTFLLRQTRDQIFDGTRNALRVFFDEKFNEIGDIHSFGHDIEATWLVDLACETLGDPALTAEFRAMNLRISRNILETAYENGTLNNEREHGIVDKRKIWWVQAETVVGFLNAYQKSGDGAFLSAARAVWDYIQTHIIDRRTGRCCSDSIVFPYLTLAIR
ncbi:MAG: AGE family epimerase/isomerase, partial [Oscillospiraceae bacterium]